MERQGRQERPSRSGQKGRPQRGGGGRPQRAGPRGGPGRGGPRRGGPGRGGPGRGGPGRGGGPRGGRGGPRRPDRGGGRRRLSPQQQRQVKQLVEKSHIPYASALKVVLGQSSLNEVLQELLREDKVKNLMATHEFSRALATSVALGRADLDTILLRRRKNDTLEKNYARTCLQESIDSGNSLGLALHGHKRVRGKVLSNGKYDFQFLEDGKADPIEIHKTHIKYGYAPADFKTLRKVHSIDNHVKKQKLDPIMRVKDRHHFKNLTLQRSMDEGIEIEVISLEGDVFKGVVTWFGRWEFGLRVKGGAEIIIFRHAVYRLHIHQRGKGGADKAGRGSGGKSKGGKGNKGGGNNRSSKGRR